MRSMSSRDCTQKLGMYIEQHSDSQTAQTERRALEYHQGLKRNRVTQESYSACVELKSAQELKGEEKSQLRI